MAALHGLLDFYSDINFYGEIKQVDLSFASTFILYCTVTTCNLRDFLIYVYACTNTSGLT